ncbi:putative tyrosine specific protein phosphatase [Plasmopara halstedii]
MMASPVKAREWEKSLTVKCRLCGGARCKRCSESAALAKVDSPVKGLHADWVADCALAMMRPSSRLMNEYNIVQQFHLLNITAVFNLTLPGEHPYCGDGLGTSGFPYDPEKDLMARNSKFYNFGWEDMTTPTLSLMMDIVKVIASVLLKGHHRIAVHCHAGYGRTGITIACALIFLHNISAELAIRLVRRDRPGSIQTSGQVQFVHDFHTYINAARIVFALPKIHDQFTLAETIEHQNRRLHGEDAVKSNLPRILDFLCIGLENAIAVTSDVEQIASAFVHHLCIHQQEAWPRTNDTMKDVECSSSKSMTELLDQHRKFIVLALNESHLDVNSFETIKAPEVATCELLFPIKVGFNVGEWNWKDASALCSNLTTYAILLLDWLEHLREPLLSSRLTEKLLQPKSTKSGNSGIFNHSRCDSECHGNTDNANFEFQALHRLPALTMRALDRVLSCLRLFQDRLEQARTKNVLFYAVCVRSAMALFHLSTTCCTTISLRRHAECIALLIDKWHAPKRLELNLESLKRLTFHQPSTCRLTQSASKIDYKSDIDFTPNSDSSKYSSSFLILHPESETVEVQSKETNKFTIALTIASTSSSLQAASSLRIDPASKRISVCEEEAKSGSKASNMTHSPLQKKIELSPITSQSLPAKDFEFDNKRIAAAFSTELPGMTCQMSSLTLPSVCGGFRSSQNREDSSRNLLAKKL